MDRDEYQALWQRDGGPFTEQWIQLFDLLAERQGWHFVAPGGGVNGVWCFGLEGACRLAASIQAGIPTAYVAETDTEHSFNTVADLAPWLEGTEPDFEGFTELQRALLDPLLAHALDEWSPPAEQDP